MINIEILKNLVKRSLQNSEALLPNFLINLIFNRIYFGYFSSYFYYFIFTLVFQIIYIGIMFYFGIGQFELYKSRLKGILSIIRMANTITGNNKYSYLSMNDSYLSASLVYIRDGKQYILNIPYNKYIRGKMFKFNVYLMKDGNEINVTQQPGIPYLVTAKELGGDNFVLFNKLTRKKYILAEDKIPSFSQGKLV